MMAPVGRLVLVRSVDKRNLVDAMTWVTMPALIGPLLGPPLGGFITTYFSWHWIFLINIPIGLARHRARDPLHRECPRRDRRSRSTRSARVLAGIGIGGLAFGLTAVGPQELPAGRRAGRDDRGRRAVHRALHPARPPHPGAGDGPLAVPPAELPRRRRRRLPVSGRRRRAAVPAAADAAARLPQDAVPVRPDHLRDRGRRHEHEDRDPDACCAASATATC